MKYKYLFITLFFTGSSLLSYGQSTTKKNTTPVKTKTTNVASKKENKKTVQKTKVVKPTTTRTEAQAIQDKRDKYRVKDAALVEQRKKEMKKNKKAPKNPLFKVVKSN